jgi:hypothetical protein
VGEDQWADAVDYLSDGGTVLVDMPLSVCRRTLEEARHLTMRQGLPLPLEVEVWREALLGEDLPGIVEPASPALSPAEAAQLLPTTGALLEEIFFTSWFFPSDQIDPFMDEADQLEENRWDERWDTFVEKVLRRLVPNDVREQLRARLERQAALLVGLEEHDVARLTMAAAWGLSKESGIQPHEHPFLQEMVDASFDNVWDALDEEWGDEEGDEEEWDEEEEEYEEERSEAAFSSPIAGPLLKTEDEWRAFITRAQSPNQVLSAWFAQYPPADMDQINEVTEYLMVLWNSTARPELGGRSPAQASGIPAPKVPPMPKPRPAAVLPPPGPTTPDDVMDQVRAYYKGIDWEPALAEKQVLGYLQNAHQQGASPDDLAALWHDVEFFIFFLDHYGDEIRTMEDLRPYHLSEWVTDFAERKVLGGMSLDDKRHLLGTARALYDYLAQAGAVNPATAQAVDQAVAQITKSRRGLVRIERPDPLGGETMMMVSSARGEFVYSLNDVWLIQVCDRDFKRDWQRMRQAAQKVPGSALKLRFIDRLQQAQNAGEDLFSVLVSYPANPHDLDVARHMFRQQEMTEGRAW